MGGDDRDIIREAVRALPPGGELTYERTTGSGDSVGAGARTVGGDLSENFTGTPAEVNLGGASASGGGFARVLDVQAPQIDGLTPWLAGGGVVALAVAGAMLWAKWRAAALYAALLGVVLLIAAWQPWVLWVGLAGLGVLAAWPLIRAEIARSRLDAATARIAEAVEGLPDDVRKPTKAAIAKSTDAKDKRTIDRIKAAHRVRKPGA